METVMMKSPLVLTFLLYVLGSANAVTMSFTEKKKISASGTTKMATCDITVSIEAGVVNKPASSVKCIISWPKAKALSKTASIAVIVGDVNSQLSKVTVGFKLVKAKGDGAAKTKTNNPSFTPANYWSSSGDSTGEATYPSDLWCPQEDKIVYVDGGAFVNESSVADWTECAELCASYVNDAGNAPCFSWTFNNAADNMYGLEPGVCRLLPYASVHRQDATSAGELGAPVSSHRSSLLLSLVLVTVFTH